MESQELIHSLQTLYSAEDRDGVIPVRTGGFLESNRICFLLCTEENRRFRLETPDWFAEHMACRCANGWKDASPVIEPLAAPFGVRLDTAAGRLFLRWRRNDMPLAQAVTAPAGSSRLKIRTKISKKKKALKTIGFQGFWWR